jgi:hypothetical protein
MATSRQIPATVDLELISGDDWARVVDFNISLIGYTFECRTSTGVVISVAETDLSLGQITLSMSDAITKTLQNGSTWYLKIIASGYERTVLAGMVSLK